MDSIPPAANPFRPGAGHPPPHLAGRSAARESFRRLLRQQAVVDNLVLTGLRGMGKTVLLDAFRPLAFEEGWRWVGADMSEAASVSEDHLAVRLCADLALVTSGVFGHRESRRLVGFGRRVEVESHSLTFERLLTIYRTGPGLSLDRLKRVLGVAWQVLSATPGTRGVVFAWDEAHNLSDREDKDQYPLALLLDAFQWFQKQGVPFLLVLTGLPTLYPGLVESRAYSERMFRVLFLDRLNQDESREAIVKPLEDGGALRLADDSVDAIIELCGGYPYFLQLVCRDVFDAFIQSGLREGVASVRAEEIERKLDADFFAGKWARATERQRELLRLVAHLDARDDEFTVRQIVEASRGSSGRAFSGSHVNQLLASLGERGLVFKNRRGRYSFAIPRLDRFIRRQSESRAV